jgi:hypothetical protein
MEKCCIFYEVRIELYNTTAFYVLYVLYVLHIILSLHDVYEINTFCADHVCLSVCQRDQLENHWTDLDGILYGRFAIGGHPKLVHFNFLQLVISTWRTSELVRLRSTPAPHTMGWYNVVWFSILEKKIHNCGSQKKKVFHCSGSTTSCLTEKRQPGGRDLPRLCRGSSRWR